MDKLYVDHLKMGLDITPLIPKDTYIFDSYAPGLFRLRGEVYKHPLIVFPNQVTVWSPPDFVDLAEGDFAGVVMQRPELILLGTGPQMHFLPKSLRLLLKGQGVAIESMSSANACKTYNVLVAEGRSVCAVLYLP